MALAASPCLSLPSSEGSAPKVRDSSTSSFVWDDFSTSSAASNSVVSNIFTSDSSKSRSASFLWVSVPLLSSTLTPINSSSSVSSSSSPSTRKRSRFVSIVSKFSSAGSPSSVPAGSFLLVGTASGAGAASSTGSTRSIISSSKVSASMSSSAVSSTDFLFLESFPIELLSFLWDRDAIMQSEITFGANLVPLSANPLCSESVFQTSSNSINPPLLAQRQDRAFQKAEVYAVGFVLWSAAVMVW